MISKDTKQIKSENPNALTNAALQEDLQKIRTQLLETSPAKSAGIVAFYVAMAEITILFLSGAVADPEPTSKGCLLLLGLSLIPITLISGSVYMFLSAQKSELMEKYDFLKNNQLVELYQSIQIQKSAKFSNCLGVECLQPEKAESSNSYEIFSLISIIKDILNAAENNISAKEIYTYSESEFDQVIQRLTSKAFEGRFAVELD